ncbi:MAG TPA: hypothetical protein VNZ01_09395 [Solirubrobacteraceae bacterium]|jgi:hypothetical protein|nr:hypothetical protein [Solirubrobacteraceae bacterium]
MLYAGMYLSYKFWREMVRRTTGVPVEAPLLAAIFAVGVVADAIRGLIAPAFRPLRPRSPSASDAMWAIAVPPAIVRGATGVKANDAPLVGAAIGFGLIAPALSAIAALARMVPAGFAALRRFATGRS